MKRLLGLFLTLVVLLAVLGPVRAKAISISVRVGVGVNMPPYQFTDDAGKISGFHIDIMDAVAEMSGLMLEYVPYQNTYDAMQALQNNELDLVLGVPANKYRADPAIFSDDINSSALCLVADNLTAERYRNAGATKRVVAVLESDTIDYNHMNSMNFISTVLRDNQTSSFQTLRQGHADMLVGIRDCTIYLLRENSLEDDYTIITNYMATVSFNIGAHREDQYLVTRINRGLAELHTTGAYENLYDKWSMLDDTSIMVGRLKNVLVACGLVMAAVVVYFVITLRIKRMLEKEVALRTSELNDANEQVRVMNERLEEKLLRREAYNHLLDSIIEASPTGMLLLDDKGDIVHSNSHAGRLMELVEQGAAPHTDADGDFRQVIREHMGPAAPQASTGSLVAGRNDGEPSRLRYHIHRISDGGSLAHMLVTIEDVTAETIERDAAFEKRKNKALNNMIAGIAHEVKNPLTTISAAIDMVYAKRHDVTFMEAFREVVPQEVARINRLVQNLVSYARPSETVSTPVEVGQLVAALERLTGPLAGKNNVTLDFNAEADLRVLASRDKLTQVLLNLVLNGLESIDARLAGEAGDYRPALSLCARRRDRFVSIVVRDNGTGMSEQQVKQCTQPFYSTKAAGTGLGLPVSAAYVSEIGGVFQVDSALGEFSQITIFLPVQDAGEGKHRREVQ